MAELTAADSKLVQYLNEAYGLEQRLETALEAHVSMTTDAGYRKRLSEHLRETKRHAREVKKRIRQLGGDATTIDPPGPAAVTDAAQAVLGGAQKAVALAQGPLHAIRGTGTEEKHLKNAKTEYANESEEIANYTGIEALAAAIGDKHTQKLAREILREEQRMRSYLEKQIPRFTNAVARAEIPASQRARPAGSRKRSTRTKAKAKTRAATGGKAKGATRGKAKGAARGKAKASTRAKAQASTRAKAKTTTRAKRATRSGAAKAKARRAR
jgi:ferritin-like metal-binding protein YciE